MPQPPENVPAIIWRDATAHKRALAVLAFALFAVLVLLYYSFVKELFLITAFIGIAAASRLWQRFFPVSVGADFIMLFTVISGVLYGSFAGALQDFFPFLRARFLRRKISLAFSHPWFQ